MRPELRTIMKLPLPLAIMSFVSGIVLWFGFAGASGFKIAGQISVATMLIVIGVLNICRPKRGG